MKYSHAKAQRAFDRKWAETEAYFRENGMTEEQIAAMREFDLEAFNSDRRYREHTVALTSHGLGNQEAYEQDFDHYDKDNWLDALPEELSEALKRFPKEQLHAFFLNRVEGYTQQEIAVMMSSAQCTISRRIGEIDRIISSVHKTGVLTGCIIEGDEKTASENLEN